MGGLMAKMPTYYQAGQTVRDAVDFRRLAPGFRAVALDPVAEYSKELPRGDFEGPNFERLNQEQYDEIVAADELSRQNFRPNIDQLEFESSLGQYTRRDVPMFRIEQASAASQNLGSSVPSPAPPSGGPQPSQPSQPDTPATRRITPVAPVTGNVLGRTDQSAQPLFGRAGRRRGANVRPPALAPASVTQKTLLGG